MIDLTGRRFGRLVALARVGTRKGKPVWRCQCACGAITEPTGESLRRGHTQSCGCFQRERVRLCNTTHGYTCDGKTAPEYRAWTDIRTRCTNPENKRYKDYGGRGITMAEQWRDSFLDFLTDVGFRPSPKHSIDRVDNDGNYEPGNVRWATTTEQGNNRRTNRQIDVEGVSMTIAQGARQVGINEGMLRSRLTRGWPLDRALKEGRHA